MGRKEQLYFNTGDRLDFGRAFQSGWAISILYIALLLCLFEAHAGERERLNPGWFHSGLFGTPTEPSGTSVVITPGTPGVPPVTKTANAAPVVTAPKPLKILVDAGHGGKDLGAQGLYGLSEKILSLRIGSLVQNELSQRLQQKNILSEVRLSRQSDLFIALKDRARLANEWRAEFFVSIHANSSPSPKPSGFEVYFLSAEASDEEAAKLATLENEGKTEQPLVSEVLSILNDVLTTRHVEESGHFAETVFGAMASALRPNKRGVRQGPFTVLAGTRMPAILIEIGYVTHPEDARNLSRSDYLKRLADAISSGIIEHVLKHKLKKVG